MKINVAGAEPYDCYVVGDSNKWVIFIYDIFGFHPNVYELADWFAANRNVSVAVPDIRRGQNWPRDSYPPQTPELKKKFYEGFMVGAGNPVARLVDLKACVDFLNKEKKAEALATVGFCWGAKMSILLDNYGGVCANVCPHPSFLKSGEGEKTSIPTLMMPTDTDNLTIYLAGVLRNPNPQLVAVSEDYLGTYHGFLGARGAFEDPIQKPFVEKAKIQMSYFVTKHMSVSHAASDGPSPFTSTIASFNLGSTSRAPSLYVSNN